VQEVKHRSKAVLLSLELGVNCNTCNELKSQSSVLSISKIP
jgi:hypothetical protein